MSQEKQGAQRPAQNEHGDECRRCGQRSRWEADPIGQVEEEKLGKFRLHFGGSDGC